MGRTAALAVLAMVVTLATVALGGCADDTDVRAGGELERPDAERGQGDGGEMESEFELDDLPPPEVPEIEEPEEPEAVEAYGVSAGHPEAVAVGMETLAEGGTAADAAIATAYAVSVVEPFASGLGGGGVTIVHPHKGEPSTFDYRDVVAQSGQVPSSNIGIPGFVAGMEALRGAHGSMSLDELVEPAVALAEEGVETSESLADWLRLGAHRLPGSLDHLYPGGAALAQGNELVQGELAETLRTIADEGLESFYEGELAEALASAIDGIDAKSLTAYEVTEAPPATGPFAGYQVHSAAPPLAGAALIGLLQAAESLGVEELEPGSADYIHAVGMSWRAAEQRLNWNVGDPSFVDVPLDELTDPQANERLAEQIDMGAMLPIDPGQLDGGLEIEGASTTHVTVVDADGTMVSMTNTLRNFWGSGRYALGFFLNDQLQNFGQRPGSPNEPPEPGKRTVASSAPVIVADEDGRPVLGAGTPGGRRIPMVLASVLLPWALHGHDLAEAIAAPRFHMEAGVLEPEAPLANDVADDLRSRGYGEIRQPDSAYYFGSVQALELDHDAGELRGARDERRDADWQVEQP